MASVELTADTFEKTVLQGGTVFVDFWAEWCGPCKRFAPVYEAASEQHSDIVFGKVDTEAEQALAAAANITSIPTLMGFRDGILVFAQAGALPAPMLADVIGKVQALDMDEVRAQVEQQRSGAQSG
ncbi:thioredoxin family protein [Phycicoccus sp. M110.8]|uniref:thioredoxin family protein n=1 Tax=Phycicoccus sp. M110.8 TaxID=3075433 RepID=UPI0028FD6AB4|nr:thioredoxin family protein [Phycicoccus sp. M110.8]MDU0312533.1 thioredoxin family protein [Phycicoccus sp. M110.8]HET8765957.1 thioredoxin family protein [Pedococcus sp.]